MTQIQEIAGVGTDIAGNVKAAGNLPALGSINFDGSHVTATAVDPVAYYVRFDEAGAVDTTAQFTATTNSTALTSAS